MNEIEITPIDRTGRKRRPPRGGVQDITRDVSIRSMLKLLLVIAVSALVAVYVTEYHIGLLQADIFRTQNNIYAPLPAVILTTIKCITFILAPALGFILVEDKKDQVNLFIFVIFGIISTFAYYIDCQNGYVSSTYILCTFITFSSAILFGLRKVAHV